MEHIEEFEEFRDKIESFNKQIVDIHCSLVSQVNNLNDLGTIQEQLDELTTNFYSFDYIWQETVSDVRQQLEETEKSLKKRTFFLVLLVIIPYIGILVALLLIINNYLHLKSVTMAKEMLNELEKELTSTSQKIEESINSKYSLLNKKIASFIGRSIVEKEEDNYEFYFANEIINNYIAGFDLEIDTIDQNTKTLICNMLQKELNTDITDINILLQMVKENNNQLILSRKRSNV